MREGGAEDPEPLLNTICPQLAPPPSPHAPSPPLPGPDLASHLREGWGEGEGREQEGVEGGRQCLPQA